jgi:hypothetical protein
MKERHAMEAAIYKRLMGEANRCRHQPSQRMWHGKPLRFPHTPVLDGSKSSASISCPIPGIGVAPNIAIAKGIWS